MRRVGWSVGALFAASAAAVLTLCATRPDLDGSFATWTPDEVARTACWAFAALYTARLVGSAVAMLIAITQPDIHRVPRALRWAPPLARHALRASLAGSLAVAPPAPPPVTVHVGTDGRLTTPGTRPVPAESTPPSPMPGPSTVPTRSAPRRSPPRPVRAHPRHHRVQPGDNLWAIARAELANHNGREPDDRDTMPYWLRVVAVNRATLRSGDPNLIFPGEIVELPNP